jgi:hypothetical protein
VVVCTIGSTEVSEERKPVIRDNDDGEDKNKLYGPVKFSKVTDYVMDDRIAILN